MPIASTYKLYFSSDRRYVRSLKNLLGFVPGNLYLYHLAFRHKSVAPALHKAGAKSSNERLEFLGDAILGSVVAELLFKKYPYRGEGFLTEMRSKIVSRSHLNQLSKKLGIDELIQYDSRMIHFQSKQGSLLGDAFEALIGAIFLDKGYEFTRNFIIKRIIRPHVDIQVLEETETNFKSRLIEWCQQTGKEVAFVQSENSEGDSAKMFTVDALINGQVYGTGKDYSKKSAEKLAAEKACEVLSVI